MCRRPLRGVQVRSLVFELSLPAQPFLFVSRQAVEKASSLTDSSRESLQLVRVKSATARWLKTVRKEVRVQSFALVVSASLCQVFVKFLLADWKSFVDVSLQLGV